MGSLSAEARPNFIMTMMRVRKPIPPIRRRMRNLCINERGCFLALERFLEAGREGMKWDQRERILTPPEHRLVTGARIG